MTATHPRTGTPSVATLRGMMAQFSEVPVLATERLGTGTSNDVFRVALADNTSRVLRVLRNQTPAGVAREIEIQRALLAAGLHSPVPLPLRSGEVLGTEAGFGFAVMEYAAGVADHPMSTPLARELGRTMARFHAATAELTLDHHDWLDPSVLRGELTRIGAPDRAGFDALLTGTETLFTAGFPETTIHGDLYLENVMVVGGHIATILDLETAERNLRLLDIAQCGLGVAEALGSGPVEAANLVLDGYSDVTVIEPEERAAVPTAVRYAATACAAWFRSRGFPRAEVFLKLARAAGQ